MIDTTPADVAFDHHVYFFETDETLTMVVVAPAPDRAAGSDRAGEAIAGGDRDRVADGRDLARGRLRAVQTQWPNGGEVQIAVNLAASSGLLFCSLAQRSWPTMPAWPLPSTSAFQTCCWL